MLRSCGCSHRRGKTILQNSVGPSQDHFDRLAFPDALGRSLISGAQSWRTALGAMSIRRQDMTHPFVEHPLGPISWTPTKITQQRSGRDLHPYPSVEKALHDVIALVDPTTIVRDKSEPARDRPPSERRRFRRDAAEEHGEEALSARSGCHAARERLPSAVRRPDWARHARPRRRRDDRDVRVVQRSLQLRDRSANSPAIIIEHAGHDMWRAGDDSDAVCRHHPRHLQQLVERTRTIVDRRKNVTVQIDHINAPRRLSRNADNERE